jgi:uncharacterized protein YciI
MLFALFVEFGPTPPTEEVLEEHLDWLFPRFSEGSFILTGGLDSPDGEPRSALALLEADDLSAVHALLASDPFVRAGLCTHRVVPYIARVRAADLGARFGDDVRAIPVDVRSADADASSGRATTLPDGD